MEKGKDHAKHLTKEREQEIRYRMNADDRCIWIACEQELFDEIDLLREELKSVQENLEKSNARYCKLPTSFSKLQAENITMRVALGRICGSIPIPMQEDDEIIPYYESIAKQAVFSSPTTEQLAKRLQYMEAVVIAASLHRDIEDIDTAMRMLDEFESRK